MLNDKIKATQISDLQIQKKFKEVMKGQKVDFTIKGDDSLWYSKRLCLPIDPKLKREIIEEAHCNTPNSDSDLIHKHLGFGVSH